MMKKIIAATVLSAMTLFALPNNELELVLISKAAQKKGIVLVNMHLEGETKVKFGNLYDEYQIKLMELSMKKLTLIKHYAENFQNMTDDNANKLLDEWVAVDKATTELKSSYISKFKKVMPSADVIRYFQIENRIGLVKGAEVANLLPLAMPTVAQ